MSERDKPAGAPDSTAEGAHGRTLASLHRHAVRTDLGLGKVLDHFGLAAPTDDEIEALLGER